MGELQGEDALHIVRAHVLGPLRVLGVLGPHGAQFRHLPLWLPRQHRLGVGAPILCHRQWTIVLDDLQHSMYEGRARDEAVLNSLLSGLCESATVKCNAR